MPIPSAFVIEDQSSLASLYEDALRLVGYDVAIFRDGLEAINNLEVREAPHLILLDINMPRISGKEVYHHIRGRAKFDHTAVAITTANSVVAAEMKTELKGNDKLFIKPVGMRDLQNLAKESRPKKEEVPSYLSDTKETPKVVSIEDTKPALVPKPSKTNLTGDEVALETAKPLAPTILAASLANEEKDANQSVGEALGQSAAFQATEVETEESISLHDDNANLDVLGLLALDETAPSQSIEPQQD